MKVFFKAPRALPALLVGAALLLPQSVRADAWSTASSGRSSFRDLGDAFSVQVPLAPFEGARLVLFNTQKAHELGLTAEDVEHLQKLVLEKFAVHTVEGGESDRHGFATYYQDYSDSALEGLGHPKGDGRAVVVGEIVVELPSGQTLYLDVSLKGVGRTPLARQANGENGQYSDGYQNMSEAVQGYTASNALDRNGVQTVFDLAVIELPVEKYNTATKTMGKAALTVRVGPQTRLAQLRYHAKNPENFAKIYDYIVKRDLGLSLSRKVTPQMVERHLTEFSRNLAQQAAEYMDLRFLHGSLTVGNQTTSGRPIDFGTFIASDVIHGNFSYLYNQAEAKNQRYDIENYISTLLGYMKIANYPLSANVTTTSLQRVYDQHYKASVGRLRLLRLGLDDRSIRLLSTETARQFLEASEAMYYAEAPRKTTTGLGAMAPAAFDMSQVLQGSMQTLLLSESTQRDDMWVELAIPKAAWNATRPGDLKKSLLKGFFTSDKEGLEDTLDAYKKAVASVAADLRKGNVDLSSVIARATDYPLKRRQSSIFPDISQLMADVRNPNRTWQENSRKADQTISGLVERRLRGAACKALFF